MTDGGGGLGLVGWMVDGWVNGWNGTAGEQVACFGGNKGHGVLSSDGARCPFNTLKKYVEIQTGTTEEE